MTRTISGFDPSSWRTVAPVTPAPGPDDLVPVAPAEPTEVDRGDAGLGRAFVRGAVIGAVSVLVVCGGISLIAGAPLAAAIGVGAFAAFWGGPGFGGMMGAVLHHSRRSSDALPDTDSSRRP